MLIHPWDAARDDEEWRSWLHTRDFGQLVVNGVDGAAPVVVPTHFLYDGDAEVLLHLARPNPIWEALEANPVAVVSVHDDYAYIPTSWRSDSPETGVPTSYYAAVQLVCAAQIVDDRAGKAEILRRQLAHHQPGGDHGEVAADAGPYHKRLSAIRGLRLRVREVRAKFKYDDHQTAELRERVARGLAERDLPRDGGALAEQRRRAGPAGR
ncbi:FMN-binding negative transcriptional regulator [Nonomuraea gerenzanensis]|uniref:Transcriptional regulator n=1 Tax=Nonomuraea gerenzanensis TaxID=93944 RepID=A0A1M4DXB7_9ACTN|nr:FMN-binding negative transcriptional regulator [Nonomuraea gerenzanensis]UBU13503.1 FMN-binding negative transcriptional regulator [Nonomuraea gerenzanensis]SBO91164.1 transcriptional regulator [Nonomuraea gerenzanensis]